MFEREQLRCKLLDGRVEEIKLKHRATAAAESERTTLLMQQPNTEDETLDIDNLDEFMRIITSDEEFRDIHNSFQDQVVKVGKKRQDRVYVMEKTEFETETPTLNTPSTPTIPWEEDEYTETNELNIE